MVVAYLIFYHLLVICMRLKSVSLDALLCEALMPLFLLVEVLFSNRSQNQNFHGFPGKANNMLLHYCYATFTRYTHFKIFLNQNVIFIILI